MGDNGILWDGVAFRWYPGCPFRGPFRGILGVSVLLSTPQYVTLNARARARRAENTPWETRNDPFLDPFWGCLWGSWIHPLYQVKGNMPILWDGGAIRGLGRGPNRGPKGSILGVSGVSTSYFGHFDTPILLRTPKWTPQNTPFWTQNGTPKWRVGNTYGIPTRALCLYYGTG